MQVYSNMAALQQKQGRTEIAEGLYRKAASKCKDHVRLKKSDFRTLLVYGQTLINVAITAIAAHGHALAEDDLQHALKVTPLPLVATARALTRRRCGRKHPPVSSLSTTPLYATAFRQFWLCLVTREKKLEIYPVPNA